MNKEKAVLLLDLLIVGLTLNGFFSFFYLGINIWALVSLLFGVLYAIYRMKKIEAFFSVAMYWGASQLLIFSYSGDAGYFAYNSIGFLKIGLVFNLGLGSQSSFSIGLSFFGIAVYLATTYLNSFRPLGKELNLASLNRKYNFGRLKVRVISVNKFSLSKVSYKVAIKESENESNVGESGVIYPKSSSGWILGAKPIAAIVYFPQFDKGNGEIKEALKIVVSAKPEESKGV